MGSNCPCKYKCGNAKITFIKDGKAAKAVRENDKFSITIEPFRNELDVNENKIKRVPYEPKNKFKISAYSGSQSIECDPQEPNYSWKVEKDENEKTIKVSGEIANFSFVEPPPNDKPFAKTDIIVSDKETPGEGACGSASIYLTTTTCYYIYRYTKKWLTSTSTCEAIVKQAGYDEAEVELYAVRCEDPETTDLVENDWTLIDSGTTDEYNYCIFEYIVATEDACVDAVIARAVNENDTIEGDENGDGIVDKYDFCNKEDELKPEPPSEQQFIDADCSCKTYEITDMVSDAEKFDSSIIGKIYNVIPQTSDAEVFDSSIIDKIYNVILQTSDAEAFDSSITNKIYTLTDMISDAMPVYGGAGCTVDLGGINCNNEINYTASASVTNGIGFDFSYSIELTFTNDNNETITRVLTITPSTLENGLAGTITETGHWVNVDYSVTDNYINSRDCPSMTAVAVTINF